MLTRGNSATLAVILDRPSFKRLKEGYRNSVFRRTGILLFFLLPAFSANFAVLYFTAALLPPADFGIFYVANTFGNVLFSGSLILNMFFARYLISLSQSGGPEAVFSGLMSIERAVIRLGAPLAGSIFLAILILSKQLGVSSRLVIALMILDAFTAYIADIGRAYFQSSRQTVLLGAYTMIWMILRLALCISGVLLFGSASGGLLGVVMSAIIVYVIFRTWFAGKSTTASIKPVALPPSRTLVPAILGYGLLIVISNLDVLLSYTLLSNESLGIYSASSVFPKALLVVTMPLLQVLFPAMVGQKASEHESRRFVWKSTIALMTATIGGIVVVEQFSRWLCGGLWGVRLCQPTLMSVLLVAIVPLSALRVFVLLQFARGRDWVPLWLAIPTVIYVLGIAGRHSTADSIAFNFSAFSLVTFFFFISVHFTANRLKYRRG